MDFEPGRAHDTAVAVAVDWRAFSLGAALPAFCGMVVLLVLLAPGRVAEPLRAVSVFAGFAAISLAVEAVLRRCPRLRPAVAPLVAGGLLFSIYTALSFVIPWTLPEDKEWAMLHLDRWLFGYSWEAVWSGIQGPFLSDLLQLVYTSFYIFPFLFGLRLALRRDWAGLQQGVDRVIVGFLISYCGYLLVPVRSPYAFLEYPGPLPSFGLQVFLHEQLINTSWTKHDCFPSGHAMMSAYVAWLAWQRDRLGFVLFGPWAVLTAVATLYLRYHFLIDVVAGLVAFVAWVWISERLWGPFATFGRPRPAPPAAAA